jgi:hypothetical protein
MGTPKKCNALHILPGPLQINVVSFDFERYPDPVHMVFYWFCAGAL